MIYKEINSYDIKNNPQKIQEIMTDNTNHFDNDLYILTEGNHFKFDTDTRDALNCLALRIQNILKNTWQISISMI